MDVVLSVLVAFLGTAALLAGARRRRGSASKHGVVMMHSTVATVVGGVFSIGPAFAFCLLALLPQNQTGAALLNGFTAFAMVVTPATWFFCETLRRRVLVTEDATIKIGRRGRRRRSPWRDVTDVTHSGFLGCFLVHSRDGTCLLVSQLLMGQKEFAKTVLRNVPSQRLECERLLQELANGPDSR
jgi:hypothetical protein